MAKRKLTFCDADRQKELQESMRDHGRASAYWGLIVLLIVVIAVISYYI